MTRFSVYYTESACVEVDADSEAEAREIFERGDDDGKVEVIESHIDFLEAK